jgi:two-component sensor histidine kinase
LLIDDDEIDYMLTRRLMSGIWGDHYQLDWAPAYEAGLDAVMKNEHDIYLVDYRLGSQSGLDLMREAMARGCRMPFILLTGQGDREVDLEAMRAGAADYLVKGEITGPLLERSIRYSIERKRVEEQLKKSLAEKEVLLKEIHHRVKNNLQIISSLLNLQSGYVRNAEALSLLRESQNRVKTMALIHESLYRTSDLAKIDLNEYLRDLIASLFRSYGTSMAAITAEIDAAGALLAIDVAIPCALIVNELVSNALKYAFQARESGSIRVGLKRIQAGWLQLVVSDDGVGLPAGLDLETVETLGLRLVMSLVSQLDGRLEIVRSGGTTFRIEFPETA